MRPARISINPMRAGWLGLASCLLSLAQAAAAPPPAGSRQDAALSARGATVTDASSRLIWERCVAGMRWTGASCQGEARQMTHGEALAWAASRARTDGLAWRLPRVNELQHLRIRLNQRPQTISHLFPLAPGGWYWSSTASLNTSSVNPYDYDNIQRGHDGSSRPRLSVRQAWAVHPDTGEARGDVAKRSQLVVRLVRSMKQSE